jgi:FkbM family methyltransferase
MSISPKINGINYLIKNETDVIQNTLLNGIQWNVEIINIIQKYISNKQLTHFLNIGSHIGSVCLPISLNISKVTAIEAYPPTCNFLCENIVLNNILNVSSYNIAVGNNEEIVYFMSQDKICPVENVNRVVNNSGGMHVFTENDILHNIRSSNLTDHQIKGVMHKFDNLDIDNFDIMLVDIEGCEYEFLLGATEKLIKNKPIIIIEIWDNDKRTRENMQTTQSVVIDYIVSLHYKLINNIGDDFIFEPI